MDEYYTLATARYIELNPVKAGSVKRAEEYRWSSAKAHLLGEDDILVKTTPLLEINPDWQELLLSKFSNKEYETLKSHERTGRPLGSETFVEQLEKLTSKVLRKQKPGPRKDN